MKILHSADWHLDAPMSGKTEEQARFLRQELSKIPEKIAALAKAENCDLMLLAGDLFDGAYTQDSFRKVCEALESVKIPVFITPGNHDPAGVDSIYNKIKFSDNVYVFSSDTLTSFDFPEINCTVYGYGFTSNRMERFPVSKAHQRDKNRINILAAHADMTSPISPYAPLSERELEALGFDYTALGHIHNCDGVKALSCGGYYAYSGCLEGRGFDETGEKGVITARLEKSEGKLSFDSKFISFSKRTYITHQLDVTGCESNGAILAKINQEIKEAGYNDKHAVKFILTGLLAPSLRVFTHYLEKEITSLFLLKVEDNTLPLYESAALKADPSIRGALFDKLSVLLESEDPEKREIASMALRYGLIALEGGETSDFTY